ncbi:MAG: class I SAM-dependent methyltransferase [Elusimicrobia bacterium]|nr:class I SAM-dependent methyltransferase [Elusimicrobiota bacterium]MBP9128357.1 class I SAM-dependent methyltransferase [Elusimicrobiota bacterium]
MAHIRPLPSEGDDSHQSTDAGAYASAMDPLREGFRYHHRRLADLLIRHLKKPGRLLEVGCNRGEFLRVAQSMGFEVTGVEPARGLAIGSEGIPIFNEPIERVRLPQNHFDAAVAIQVIEHLRDPSVLLEQMLKSLKPGGLIYIETPNYGSLARRWGSPRFMNLNVAPGHWHLFNRKSLRFLLERHGVKPLRGWTFYKALSVYGKGLFRIALVGGLNRTLGMWGLANTLAVLAQKRS